MKTSGVSQISILTSSEGEEPIAALLERIFGVAPSVYMNAETQRTTITAYVRAAARKLRLGLEGLEPSIRHGKMSVNFKNSESETIQRGSMVFSIPPHSVVTVRLVP